jgi:Gram-negative bacterial TonB protein C-terminal
MRALLVRLSALAVACASFGSPAQAADLVLPPTSEWKLREYDDKCRVSRTFGEGEDSVTLWIDQGSLSQAYNLTLIGRPLRHPYGPNLSVQFAPEPEYSRNYIYAESSKGRPVVTLFGVRLTPTNAERELLGLPLEPLPASTSAPKAEPTARTAERAAAITEIRFGRALIAPLSLQTGALTVPLEQLQNCAADLERRIGVNTALASSTPRPVNQAAWAAELQKSYPNHLARAEQEARINVRLTIATTGRPTFCEVPEVEGLTSFNDTACWLLLKHATFEPARNAAGEPLVARYALRVTFVLND